jgi:periplasmic divalent cation tolerance protein
MASSDALVVMTTAPDDEVAERLARALVEEGLAGCVQRLPIRSTYSWEGRVEEGTEVLLVIKTTEACWSALARRVQALSPYDVPEVVAVRSSHVAPAYAAWLAGACAPRKH